MAPASRRFVTSILILAALAYCSLGFPGQARADDTALGSFGGGVYAQGSKDIRLARETVQAVMYGSFAEYFVDFEFVNEGPEQEVLLGFPFAHDLENSEVPPAYGFRAWHEGRPLEVELRPEWSGKGQEPGRLQTVYFVHSTTIAPGLSHITVRYLARPGVSAGRRFEPPAGLSPGWFTWYSYWLRTGAGWKGDIAKAVIRHSLADTFLGWGADIKSAEVENQWAHWTTYPEHYAKPEPAIYQWVFKDFEPVPRVYLLAHYMERGASKKTIADTRSILESLPGVQKVELHEEVPLGSLPADVPPDSTIGVAYFILEVADEKQAQSLIEQSYEDEGLPNLGTFYGPGYLGFYPYDITFAYTQPQPFHVGAGSEPGPRVKEVYPQQGPGDTSALRKLLPGSRVEFELLGLDTVREIRLVPGALDSGSYDDQARPKRLRFSFGQGQSVEVELLDSPEVQRFSLEASAGPVRMEVLDLYPGKVNEEGVLWAVEFGEEAAPAFMSFEELIQEERGLGDPLASTYLPKDEASKLAGSQEVVSQANPTTEGEEVTAPASEKSALGSPLTWVLSIVAALLLLGSLGYLFRRARA